ncbi:MAG: hypothetical protein AB7O28_25300 [Vicinamibacterales bacterium]
MPIYRPDILDALAAHGLVPTSATEPAVLRRALSRLYRHEIRALRDRCRSGEFPVRELAGRVVALRRRYLLLSTPLDRWTLDAG